MCVTVGVYMNATMLLLAYVCHIMVHILYTQIYMCMCIGVL